MQHWIVPISLDSPTSQSVQNRDSDLTSRWLAQDSDPSQVYFPPERPRFSTPEVLKYCETCHSLESAKVKSLNYIPCFSFDMSWRSQVWNQAPEVLSGIVDHVKEWYAVHPLGQYALAIILVFWAGHIISQLVFPFLILIEGPAG
jgi:hypothetical protein